MNKTKIILDCDPGHDDAIAIMIAAKHPAIELLGITAVAGNQTLDKTLPNALKVVECLGIDVPVYGGMSLPMVREQIVAENIHGVSGMDGPVFPPLTRKAEPVHAVTYIINTLMKSDGDITLVPTGPLSNIAMAMRLEPRILPKIHQIVLMGGSTGHGNATAAAEFNFYADPEAASIVFRSGVPIVMMGLNLTDQTVCTPDIIERMEKVGNKAGKLFGDLMRFTLETQRIHNGLAAGPVHDVTCIAWLIDPEIFQMKEMYAQIDTTGSVGYGASFCDSWGCSKKKPNALVGVSLDLNRFWNLIEETIRLYN